MSGIFLNLIAGGESPPPIKYELWTWGRNNNGQLGLNDTTNRSSPVQVGLLNIWEKLPQNSYQHGLSITSDGALWSWGFNNHGQLGLGNTVNRSSPVQVGALKTWAFATGGFGAESSLAIKTDGTFWTWGVNGSGQLGHSNTIFYSSPKQVGALTNWASGGGFFVVVKTDGTMWSWGDNQVNGPLGLGNTTSYSSPKQIGGLTTWTKVSAKTTGCFALKTDGTVWGWGYNSGYAAGELGLGNSTSYSSPVQVTTGASFLSSHYRGGVIIKTNGTLFAWGKNNFGQLGDGTTTNRSTPVQIGSLTTWESVAGLRASIHALKDPV